LQRLFSSFAGGWAGAGLLLQRMLTAILLVRACIIVLTSVPFSLTIIPDVIAGCAAILLLIGLWTPIVGALIFIIQLSMAITHTNDPWMPIALATLSGATAMIGPGAWSIDARLFGRKHVKT
jgi:uncharacterized membrane protein YphA (DoxX/SURF4 family)